MFFLLQNTIVCQIVTDLLMQMKCSLSTWNICDMSMLRKDIPICFTHIICWIYCTVNFVII